MSEQAVIDAIEPDEAPSSPVVAVIRDAERERELVNPSDGAIALGSPAALSWKV